jgi:putative transposase
MLGFLWLWFGVGAVTRFFGSRQNLLLENLALRHQITVLKRRHPRPKLSPLDKLFWLLARKFWSAWKQSLLVVTPETVVRWHRAGFRLYWSWLSRHRVRSGRNPIRQELRELIFRMVAENPTWGAPRIHGELQMLGFNLSERTVSRWVRRAPRNPEPARRWKSFLGNHCDAIAAMDSFTVPIVNLRGSVLLFHHQPRPQTNPTLQRNQASDPGLPISCGKLSRMILPPNICSLIMTPSSGLKSWPP